MQLHGQVPLGQLDTESLRTWPADALRERAQHLP